MEMFCVKAAPKANELCVGRQKADRTKRQVYQDENGMPRQRRPPSDANKNKQVSKGTYQQ